MEDYHIYGLFSIAEMYFNIARKLEQQNKSRTQYNEEIEYYFKNLDYSPATLLFIMKKFVMITIKQLHIIYRLLNTKNCMLCII